LPLSKEFLKGKKENLMEFYALAYKPEVCVYFDFANKENVKFVDTTCLLPAEEMAQQYIADHLNDDYMVVAVSVDYHSSKTEETNFSIDPVPDWDEEMERREITLF